MKCIKNGIVLTMDENKNVIENGYVIIKGDSIEEIGSMSDLDLDRNFDDEIDAKGGIIMPGFINGHCHISMSIFRGIGEDVKDRLRKFIFPLENELVTPELVYKGARLSIAEMLLGGVTTFVDMYYFEDEVAKAAKEMGIRCILGQTVLMNPSPDSKEPYGGIELAKEFIEKWSGDDIVTPTIAPHSTYTNDAKHLKIVDKISKEYDVPIIMHVSETDFEIEMFKEKYNMTPTEYLDSIGLLSDRLIGAHFAYMTDSDIELLAKRDVGVIHNPTSNAKSARAISPVTEMLSRGIRVGIGTDGAMSSNHQDILSIMHQYTKFQKISTGNRSIATAIDAVTLGTIGGARAIKMDNSIGSLEGGKKADIIIIETNAPNMTPLHNYYSNIVYSAYPSNVTTTIVNGQVLVRDKKLQKSDLIEILDAANEYKKEISELLF